MRLSAIALSMCLIGAISANPHPTGGSESESESCRSKLGHWINGMCKHSGGKVEVPKGDSSKPKGASKGLFKLFKTSNIHQPKEPQDLPTQEHTNEVLATIDMEPNHGSPGSTDTSTGPDEAIKAEARQTKKNKWPAFGRTKIDKAFNALMIGLEEDPSDYIDTSTGPDEAIKPDVYRTKKNKWPAFGRTKASDIHQPKESRDPPTQEQVDKAFNALMIGLEEDPSDYIDTSTGSDGAIKADVHRTKDNKGSALGQTKGADPKSLFKSPKSKGKTTNPPMQQRIKPKRGTYLTGSGRNRRPRAGLDGLYHKYGFKKGSKRQNKLYRSGRKAPRTYAQYLREREARLQADLNKSGQETTDTPRKFVPVKRPWYDFIWTKPKRKTGTPFKQFVHEWKAQHQASLDRSRQRTTGTSRKYNPEDEAQHPLEKEAQRRASLG
ncbi:hypothetical protein BASA62_004073 [Batrachochytrium salamandrivorans]|nr:hypothetical protein BASA62_004073 [Batrachochytrium salamandrivorans]